MYIHKSKNKYIHIYEEKQNVRFSIDEMNNS